MSKEEEISRFRSAELVLLGLIVVLPLLLTASAPATQTEDPLTEPSLATILNTLGHTNIALSSAQTFQAGAYEASLLAEIAGYRDTTESGYYPVDTSVFTYLCARAAALAVADNEGRWDTESTTITTTQNVSCLYCLDVKTSPVGIAVIPGAGVYQHGTNVTLHAPAYAPDEGGTDGQRHRFDHWDVDCTPVAGNPITVLMTANHTATAHYVLQYLITFTHTGLDNTANSTVATVNGALHDFSDLPLTLWADQCTCIRYGYYAAITSTTTGKRFALDHVTGPNTPFTVTSPTTITGHYRVQYLLTVTTTTGGTTNRPSGGWFDTGTMVPVLALPDPDYVLDHWELDGTPLGSANPHVVVMNAAHHLHAAFEHQPPPPTEYYLTVKTNPPGITSIPGEGFYDVNSDAILATQDYVGLSTGIVIPLSRYRFDHWDVDGTPREEGITSTTVHMDANHTATAHYVPQYYLVIRVVPSGVAVIPGEGWYNVSTIVLLTAPDVNGYEFLHWNVDGILQGDNLDSISVKMDKPHTATATYRALFVGGVSAVVELPPLTVWVGVNSLLAATVVIVRFWVKRRRRTAAG